jgi:hypothetical protein
MYSNQCLDSGRREEASAPISRAYDLMVEKEGDLSDLEKVRVVGLANRLAELFESEGKDMDAEIWYSRAIEHSLKWFKVSRQNGKEETIVFPTMVPSVASWLFNSGEQAHLKPDPSAPFVNIARLYSRQGRVELRLSFFN